jgi:hypothetical protein
MFTPSKVCGGTVAASEDDALTRDTQAVSRIELITVRSRQNRRAVGISSAWLGDIWHNVQKRKVPAKHLMIIFIALRARFTPIRQYSPNARPRLYIGSGISRLPSNEASGALVIYLLLSTASFSGRRKLKAAFIDRSGLRRASARGNLDDYDQTTAMTPSRG